MAGEVISKSQADRLGEELRHGEITADRIERLSAYREQLVRNARSAAEAIRAQTLYPVTPREGKSTGSIVAKLRRQPIALSRMQDIVGCRVIVDTAVEQNALVMRIQTRFPEARLTDRRIEPSYGYRAVHFIVAWEGKPYEIQLRTRLQHAWAQTVERLSDNKYPDLKYGKDYGQLSTVLVEGHSDLIRKVEEVELRVFQNRSRDSVQGDNAELGQIRSLVLEMLENLLAAVKP
ncbi:MAG TPA: RelA/SpoT domain-containing protein [Candidatus Elarobacter sp.]|jgi:ppGpp synthetase/RelA/SpoT-type nucleotidyltranferase